jgi:hypothetical protein
MCQRYANAPMMLLSIHTQWPLLDPSERNMFLQQWSVELPYMASMLGPVLAEAQALDGIHHETRARIDATRRQAAPAADTSEQQSTSSTADHR